MRRVVFVENPTKNEQKRLHLYDFKGLFFKSLKEKEYLNYYWEKTTKGRSISLKKAESVELLLKNTFFRSKKL